MMAVAPFLSRIVQAVFKAFLVRPFQQGSGPVAFHSVFRNDTFHACCLISIDENVETAGTILQDKVGQPSHDDTRFLGGDIAYYPALGTEHGGLRRIIVHEDTIHRLLAFGDKPFAETALPGCQRDQLAVIKPYPQPLRQQLSNVMAATTIFPGYSDDKRPFFFCGLDNLLHAGGRERQPVLRIE